MNKLPSNIQKLNAMQIAAHRAISEKPEPIEREHVYRVRPYRTFREVAEILGMRENTVRKIFWRAMEKLRSTRRKYED